MHTFGTMSKTALIPAAAFLARLEDLAPGDRSTALAYMIEMTLAKTAPFEVDDLVNLLVDKGALSAGGREYAVILLRKLIGEPTSLRPALFAVTGFGMPELDRIEKALPDFRTRVVKASAERVMKDIGNVLPSLSDLFGWRRGPKSHAASKPTEKPTPKDGPQDFTRITFTPAGSPVVTSAATEAPQAPSKPSEPTKADVEPSKEDLDKIVDAVVRVCQSKGPGGVAALSDIYDRLPYSAERLREAIHESTARGLTILHSTGLLETVAKLPTTIMGWTKAAYEGSASKGWYEAPGFSEKVARILGRLPAEDVTELMHYLPTGQREPKSKDDVATFCANITGEISELWEAFRAGHLDKPCDKADKMTALGLPGLTCVEEEMADIAIRLFDTAEFWGVDLEKAIRIKHLFNAARPHRHGGKLA